MYFILHVMANFTYNIFIFVQIYKFWQFKQTNVEIDFLWLYISSIDVIVHTVTCCNNEICGFSLY